MIKYLDKRHSTVKTLRNKKISTLLGHATAQLHELKQVKLPYLQSILWIH